jgi:drug/metabolite transporter (DMT)-like permease
MADARAGAEKSPVVPAGQPADHHRRDLAIGIACAVATVAIWSGFILISRASAGSRSLLPTDLAALRFGVAAAIMLPVLLWRLRTQSFTAAMGGMTPARILLVALTAGCGFSLFAFSGFAFAPVAHAGVLLPGALPFLTALAAWVVLHERVGRQRAVGLALILAGIVTIGSSSWSSLSSGINSRMLLGDLLFLCASTSWAVFVVYARKWQLRPVEATIALACGAALLYLPAYLAFLPRRIGVAPLWEVLGQAFYQGTFSVVISTLVYTRVLMTFGATRTAMITAVVPGMASLLAVPVLGEPLAASAVAGLALVTVGMVAGVVTLRR